MAKTQVCVPEIVPVLGMSVRSLMAIIKYVMGPVDRRPLWERALETRKVRT
jgi:hypothetical protein